jgi:hypothetical protein
MGNYCVKSLLLSLVFLLVAVSGVTSAQPPAQEQPPDDASGNWTIYAKNIDNGGSSTKYAQIKQNGNHLTGHFKGPHQSGGIEGTVNVHHIEFSTKTHDVLTFRGQIEGNTMSGLYGLKGRHAEWRATRTN